MAHPRLEQYRKLGLISRGSAGEVYRAFDTLRQAEVALKLLHRDKLNTETRQRFEREAAILIRLSHPNIVRTFDFGVDDSLAFMVMELVRGRSLEQHRAQAGGVLPWPPLRLALGTLAATLAYLHGIGVVHRDLKPENMLIEDGSGRPVLIDFGLARVEEARRGDLDYTSLTRQGQILGTPAFMSPEQLDSRGTYGPVGPASDVWSFGATLFFCLTGEAPFSARSTLALFIQATTREPRRLSELLPTAPLWLDELVRACLQRRQDDRPDMAELARLLAPGA